MEKQLKCGLLSLYKNNESLGTCMMNHKTLGDEFDLYLLCRQHSRHAIIFTVKGFWMTLLITGTETEEELCSKCDVVLMLIGHGGNGFSEIKVLVTADKDTSEMKRISKTVSVQEFLSDYNEKRETRSHAKSKVMSSNISYPNIIPDNGKPGNTRGSNWKHKRHTNQPVRNTAEEVDYTDLNFVK